VHTVSRRQFVAAAGAGEIWRNIEELSRDGAAVVLVSTDFDDIAALCSRCLVFAQAGSSTS
jgi:ABC-type sugar transport system ATPase subunit